MDSTTTEIDIPAPARRSCARCGSSYWADRFDLCPDCDGAYLLANCGEKYAARARRVRDQIQSALAQINSPAEVSP
jgi:ribosomal protein S27AE